MKMHEFQPIKIGNLYRLNGLKFYVLPVEPKLYPHKIDPVQLSIVTYSYELITTNPDDVFLVVDFIPEDKTIKVLGPKYLGWVDLSHLDDMLLLEEVVSNA